MPKPKKLTYKDLNMINTACVAYIQHNGGGQPELRAVALVAMQIRDKAARKMAVGVLSDSHTLKLTAAELETAKVLRTSMNLCVDMDNALFRLIQQNTK